MMKSKLFLLIVFIFSVQFNFAQEKKPKIGLVLSGGGAKGYAHIGALKAIEESGVKIDYIGGTSIGAIIGSLYASGYNASQLEEVIKKIDLNQAIFKEVDREETPFYSKLNEEKYFLSLEFDNFDLKLPKSLSNGQGTLNIITEYLSHVHQVNDFNKLPTPFFCIATNIETGKQKIFKSGDLPEVVMASGAYPTLFKPVKVDDSYYIDGGVTNNYPAQEVLNMGADYLIGIDLGAELKDYEDISSATSIIEQIVSFGIEEKTEQQRKLIDLSIIPDVKEISVTNFELKDSILQEGYNAAVKLKPKLDSLRKVQGNFYTKEPLIKDSTFVVREIRYSGLKQYGESYVLGKLGIPLGKTITYNHITKGISSLYATENFTQIEHKLINTLDGNNKILELNIIENKANFYLKLGLHYDQLFKTSFLANFTAKNLLTINSTLSIDAIVGDNPRFNLNYFVDNGIKPSFGLNAKLNRFDLEKKQNLKTNVESLSYNYDFNNIVAQIYTQSTLSERYAGGLGLEYNYLKIETNNLEKDNPLQSIQNAYFLIPYAFLRADDRDNSFFPTKGLYLNSEFKYFIISKNEDFEPTSMIKGFIEYNQPITKKISLQASTSIGLSFDNGLPKGFDFNIGGNNQHQLINSFNFYGLPFSTYYGSNMIGIGTSIQYKMLNNHYIKYNFNASHLTEKALFDTFNFEYTGHGLTYGHLSPIGPLQGSLSYSPEHKKLVPYISLGYWF